MLKLTIPGTETWNTETNEFDYTESITLELEHSLVSLSKWEAIWEKPFMGPEEKTNEETLGYVQQMCMTPDVPPETFQSLTNQQMQEVNSYINAKMSATWFNEPKGQRGAPKRVVITSELLYYWMFSAQIPLECEHWHLNRLFTLLKVFNDKNADPKSKKTNRKDMIAERNRLNEERMAKYGTSG